MLNAVTCLTSADCWAVGNYTEGTSPQATYTLTEHWNGSTWTIVTSSNPSMWNNRLNAVTCVVGADCWAVGSYADNTSSVDLALTEHWDGSAWSIVSTPNPTTRGDTLNAVTCVTRADCWAVGYFNADSGPSVQTLTEHWNSSAWAIVPSPNPGTASRGTGNFLYAVTCVASADCWAAGDYNNFGSPNMTLTVHWDGSAWALVPSPNPSSSGNSLDAVTCVTSSDCWAAGDLIEHWNGSAWAIVPTPSSSLYAITCVTSADCWAVGRQALIEHWDGSAWAIVLSPSSGVLYAVTCVTSADCWAAGSYTTGTSPQVTDTLSEHWNGSAWAIVPSPNQSTHNTACPGASSITDTSCTFHAAGESRFTVPDGVTSIFVAALGTDGLKGFQVGGSAAQVTATLPSIPGAVLYVEVDRGGGAGVGDSGAGGGAADLRTCSVTLSVCVGAEGTSSDPRLVVAGGGGGGAGNSDRFAGGGGWGGANSGPSCSAGGGGGFTNGGARGGDGGSCNAGGSGGSAAANAGTNGSPGTADKGGDGASGNNGSGGGGGGGFYGGGGGGSADLPDRGGGGGGGGSSFAASNATGVRMTAPIDQITYRGPGVFISWTAPPTNVPELPLVGLTPLLAAASIGAAVVVRRRKMTSSNDQLRSARPN